MAQKTSKSLSPRGRFWRKHVQQWQRSGATQIRYCQEHDLSVPTFRWWRRKLTHGHPVVDPQKELPTSPVTTFTEIRIPEGGAAAAAYAYEIILPNRTQVRLRQNFDAEAVAALVSLLGAPC
jgi:transposase-like protein